MGAMMLQAQDENRSPTATGEAQLDGLAASRQNDQSAYVIEARDHMNHIAQHIARIQAR